MVKTALLMVTVTCVLVALLQPVTLLTDSAHAVVVPKFVPDGAKVTLPFVAVVYHTTEAPPGGVAVPVWDNPS